MRCVSLPWVAEGLGFLLLCGPRQCLGISINGEQLLVGPNPSRPGPPPSIATSFSSFGEQPGSSYTSAVVQEWPEWRDDPGSDSGLSDGRYVQDSVVPWRARRSEHVQDSPSVPEWGAFQSSFEVSEPFVAAEPSCMTSLCFRMQRCCIGMWRWSSARSPRAHV